MMDVMVKLDRLRAEHAKALDKAAEWQARAKDFEKQIKDVENSEILRVIRDITASPDEIFSLLHKLQASQDLPEQKPENKIEIGGTKKNEK